MLRLMAASSANHGSDEPVNARPEASSAAAIDPHADPVIERADDEDYDLLTFGEAGARLTEEVAKQRAVIDQLRAGQAQADIVERAEQRLSMLRAAVERNRKPSLDEMRRSGFFGRVDP
jgi:hypothetical protein